MDDDLDLDEDEKVCVVGQETGHNFDVKEICVAEFTRGNSNCRRVTRFALYCVVCGKVMWVDDPETPEIR